MVCRRSIQRHEGGGALAAVKKRSAQTVFKLTDLGNIFARPIWL